jgi:hypothetical protein
MTNVQKAYDRVYRSQEGTGNAILERLSWSAIYRGDKLLAQGGNYLPQSFYLKADLEDEYQRPYTGFLTIDNEGIKVNSMHYQQ